MTMNANVLAKVATVRDDLAANLLERETAIEAALLALLTGEHLLLLGPPGTAKSLLVRSICQRVDGARFYELMTTRFTTPEEAFGPLSLSALEQDRYQRVTTGMLPEAHIAFLDEIFKANGAILNSLLGIINERVYHEAGQALPVPLLSLFGASNESPEDDSLNALYDRFLLRAVVPPLADDASLRQLFDLQPQAPTANITLTDLHAAQDEVAQLPLTDDARGHHRHQARAGEGGHRRVRPAVESVCGAGQGEGVAGGRNADLLRSRRSPGSRFVVRAFPDPRGRARGEQDDRRHRSSRSRRRRDWVFSLRVHYTT